MTTLISNATGNLTGAATFAVVELGAGATNLIRFNNAGVFPAAGTQASVAFTVTSGKVIDGVLLFVKQLAAGSTGTIKVALQKGGVDQASVTVNKTDLPDVGVTGVCAPVFFKFTSTATGDGGANWTIFVTTTGTQTIAYAATASGATNITRALRTTTPATPAATDDLYIVGELTGAGTHNAFTVTMNSTAATVYGSGVLNSTTVAGGGFHVSGWGSLVYGVAASTNYILRINGDLRVYAFGTVNIGAAGAEIPRGSTAVLEIQQISADGDFGILCYDYSVVTAAGLSRTVSKNAVKCKLTADVASSSVLTTASTTNMNTNNTVSLEATGTSLMGPTPNENATNATHSVYFTGASITNQIQTATIWLAQGAGPANNRYVRVTLGNNTVFTAVTNGFWADLDLQAGTASAITNIGTGVGTSITMTAQGAGWLIRMVGKIATTVGTPTFIVNSCSAAGTLTYAGSTANFNFAYDHVSLVTATSISDTTYSVDTDTGWLNGDVVCITSTSRTANECELFSLNADAGASSFVTPLYPAGSAVQSGLPMIHSGTAPTQAEIGLITRNVRIRSPSPLLMAYVYMSSLATVTMAWAQIQRMGAGSGKRGLELDSVVSATANPKSFTYCCIHDFDVNGFYVNANTAVNLTVSNNVFWNTATPFNIGVITNNDWVFDNNLMMRGFGVSVLLSDVGGVCTNNTVCSNTSSASHYGFQLNEAAAIGTFDNNTVHSGSPTGVYAGVTGLSGIISNTTAWRMAGGGGAVLVASSVFDVVINNVTAFGNLTNNIQVGSCTLTINGGTLAGDPLFPTTNGINISTAGPIILNLNNVDMSGVGTGLVPHTGADILFASPAFVTGQLNNCKFGATVPFVKTSWSGASYIGFEKYNQVAGDHRCEMKFGQIRTDTTIYKALAPSQRMTPNNATNKLESAPEAQGVKMPVASGNALAVGAWYKKSDSSSGVGSVYSGAQPRLIQRANAALGQPNDVVLATASDTPSITSPPSTWNPSDAPLVTLSNGNRTVTSAGGGAGEQGVRANPLGAKGSGKFYFEVTLTTLGGGSNTGVGIATLAATFTALGSSSTNGNIMFPQAGNIWQSGSASGNSLGARSAGNVIGIAIDLDNRRSWFRVAPAGNWNGSGTADPTTNVGGVVIPAGLVVPACTFNASGSVWTGNFGASAFTGTVPSGFTSGWADVTSTSSWTQLSGTSSSATDDGVWEFIVDCDGTSGWVNADDWTFSGLATTASGLQNWFNGVPAILLAGGATLNITQDDQTLVAAGGSVVVGTLSVTQANATLVAAGGPVLGCTLAVTQAAQTLLATGRVLVAGVLTATQVDQTLDASGIVGTVSIGELVITQDNQTLAAAGGPTVVGVLARTQASQTLAATGAVGNIITGSLVVTQANETLSAAGFVVPSTTGSLVVTQANETLNATGRVAVGGALTAAQAPQTLVAIGRVVVGGALVATQASQTFAGVGAVIVEGALVSVQAAQTLAATGRVAVAGTLARTQASQTLVATGQVAVAGTLAQAQAPQVLVATGRVAVPGGLAETQADQTLVAAGGPRVAGVLVGTQVSQTLVATGRVVVGGALTVVQANETLAASGVSGAAGGLTVMQAPQILAGAGGPSVVASLTVTQADQTLAAQKYKMLQGMPLYGRRGILVLDGDASQITPLAGHRSGVELEGDASQIMALRGRRSGMNLQGSAS